MDIKIVAHNGVSVAVISSAEILLKDADTALDLIMSVKYETGCERFAINKEAVTEDFFILSTRAAGEILQKFITYRVKFAVYGDFSGYTSRPLKDFMYESNRGRDIFFTATAGEAAEKLCAAN